MTNSSLLNPTSDLPWDIKLPSIIIWIPGYRFNSSCSKISRPRANLLFIPTLLITHTRPTFISVLLFPSYFHPNPSHTIPTVVTAYSYHFYFYPDPTHIIPTFILTLIIPFLLSSIPYSYHFYFHPVLLIQFLLLSLPSSYHSYFHPDLFHFYFNIYIH